MRYNELVVSSGKWGLSKCVYYVVFLKCCYVLYVLLNDIYYLNIYWCILKENNSKSNSLK